MVSKEDVDMRPMMGVNRSDNRTSRCQAKDPDHCRYHKPGSHQPFNKARMDRMNERVAAEEATRNGTGGALRKDEVVSRPVDGSILKAGTLNKSDIKLITRLGRRYVIVRQHYCANPYDSEAMADFPIKDYSKPDTAEEAGKRFGDNLRNGIDELTANRHRKWLDSMYALVENGTMKSNIGVRQGDDKRTVVRKAVRYLITDPKFADYMTEYKKRFILPTPGDPQQGTMAGVRRILDGLK